MDAVAELRNLVGSRNGSNGARTKVSVRAAAARKALAELDKRNKVLHRYAAVLAKGNQRLEREIARRRAGEVIIKKGREHYQVLFLESQVMQKKLRSLTHQLIMAQEEERKEISRELHDVVVQTLIGINVELAALGKVAASSCRPIRPRIARTQRLVENSVKAVHRFARELRPAVLDDLGLIPALQNYCKVFAQRKKLQINITAFAGVESLDAARRIVLFRVAQEALTNVARHAEAARVELTISKVPGAVRMDIRDNGKSFEVDRVMANGNPARLGLIGMKERVEMVGGKLTIESVPGAGTTVRMEVPFTTEESKA